MRKTSRARCPDIGVELVVTGASTKRAVLFAEQAHDTYRKAGDVRLEALAEVEAFLRDHKRGQ